MLLGDDIPFIGRIEPYLGVDTDLLQNVLWVRSFASW